MSQYYNENGKLIPVTVIQAGPCTVLDQKTEERDGYTAVQLAFGNRKAKNVSNAIKGHCAKAGRNENPPAVIKEFRTDANLELEPGAELTVNQFSENDFIDVTGTTKGRGFQGVVKRYNFGGGRYSHGGGWKRKPGSIGQCEFPGNVDKGKKMPGQFGNVQRTIQNLQIVKVVEEDNLIFVKGAIPGANGGTIIIRSAKKKNSSTQG